MTSIVERPASIRTIGVRPHIATGATPVAEGGRRAAGRLASRLSPLRPPEDRLILFSALALVGIGVLEVFSASAMNFLNTPDGPYGTGSRQLLYALLGIGVMLVVSQYDYRVWRRLAAPSILVALALLVAVLLPFVATDRNLNRAIVVGPMTIHAAEFAKLALVLYLSDVLSRRGHALDDFRGTILPAGGAILLCAGLIMLEPDLGTAVVVGVTGFSMLFVGGLPLRWLVPAGLGAALLDLASIALRSYQSARLGGFLDPLSDPSGGTYQTIQGLIGIVSGGIAGKGLGSSQLPGASTIPYAWNDYIFAVIGQELGLVGAAGVLIAFLLIAFRGIGISRKAPDTFGALLALGIVVWIIGQAMINIGVVLSLLPVTGVPLPLVSQGGSAMVVLLAAIGLLLSISRETGSAAELGGTDARADRGRRDRGTPFPRIRRGPYAPSPRPRS
jgi:cell division protein FtsW